MTPTARLGPGQIKDIATTLYADVGTAMVRFMQRYRAYICPLHEVVREVPEQARVLDVGCGNGLLLNLLAHLGRIRQGHGFDVCAPAIGVAKQVAARQSVPCTPTFEVRSINEGIPRMGHEVVSVVDVLHHVPDAHKQAFVTDLCSTVPDGGRLIVKDMVCRPRWRAAANQLHDLVMARQWVEHVDLDQVESWATRHGLTTQRRAHFNTLWYGHWLLVMEKPSPTRPTDAPGSLSTL